METRAELGGDLAPAAALAAPAAAPRALDLAFGAALLAAFTALGMACARAQSLVPGAVAGFVALTVALAAIERRPGVHRVVRRGLVPLAVVLLRHMGLLFVPAGVAGVDILLRLPGRDALPVVLALAGSTLLGLAVAAIAMERARR